MTRRRKAVCRGCADAPPRRVLNATLCTPCYTRRGRPVKECIACSETFAADVLQGRRCRPCVSKINHARRVQQVYSLAEGDYQALLDYQDGKCAICLRVPRTRRLAVDHDHACCNGPISCGKCVRGLCCKQCNRWILGSVRDDVNTLQRAISYLQDPPARHVLGKDVTP